MRYDTQIETRSGTVYMVCELEAGDVLYGDTVIDRIESNTPEYIYRITPTFGIPFELGDDTEIRIRTEKIDGFLGVSDIDTEEAVFLVTPLSKDAAKQKEVPGTCAAAYAGFHRNLLKGIEVEVTLGTRGVWGLRNLPGGVPDPRYESFIKDDYLYTPIRKIERRKNKETVYRVITIENKPIRTLMCLVKNKEN